MKLLPSPDSLSHKETTKRGSVSAQSSSGEVFTVNNISTSDIKSPASVTLWQRLLSSIALITSLFSHLIKTFDTVFLKCANLPYGFRQFKKLVIEQNKELV